MKTRDDIVSQIRQALAITEPDLDTTIGSPVRKIIDAVAEPIAESYSDRHILDFQYDIEAKSGADLDEFVRQFGFTRLDARRASGTVVFERSTPSEFSIFMPVGTQVATPSRVIFYTTIPAQMPVGGTSVEVPISALIGGPDGNVAAGTISQAVSQIVGINSLSNPASTNGGTSQESDDQLRLRFRNTLFRSLAGTEDSFLGIALEDPDVTQANVIGATKRHAEQIELIDTGSGIVGISTLLYAKSVYSDGVIFGPSIESGSILTNGVHFSFNPSSPPSVASLDGTLCPAGVYELAFDYVPQASRNDPTIGVTNRIDVYVNGVREAPATDTTIWSGARVFTSTNTASDFYTGKFMRQDGSTPVAGNYLIDLSFSPVTRVADTLVISGNTYTEGQHYFLVNDISPAGGGPRSYGGIEWVSATNGGSEPAGTPAFTIDYAFNDIPRSLESRVNAWKLVTTDVAIHQANTLWLNLSLAVIVKSGYALSDIKARLQSALSEMLTGVGFDGVVQGSDILAKAASLPGVDAVRFLTDNDDPSLYAIQQVYMDSLITGAVTAASKKVTHTSHGYSNLDRIRFVGALSPEIDDTIFYYVRNKSTNDFEVSTTPTGTTIMFSEDHTEHCSRVSIKKTFATGGRATDVVLSDGDLAQLHSINLQVKAQNSFGSV